MIKWDSYKMLCKYELLLFTGLDMLMLNSGWIPLALVGVLYISSHSNSYVTSGSWFISIMYIIWNSHLSRAELGFDNYTKVN